MTEIRAALRCIRRLAPESLTSLSVLHPQLERADAAEWDLALTAAVAVLVIKGGSLSSASVMKAMIAEFGVAGRTELQSCVFYVNGTSQKEHTEPYVLLASIGEWIAKHYPIDGQGDSVTSFARDAAEVASGFADAVTDWAESAPTDPTHGSSASDCLESNPRANHLSGHDGGRVIVAQVETRTIANALRGFLWSGPMKFYPQHETAEDRTPVLIIPVTTNRLDEIWKAIQSVLILLETKPVVKPLLGRQGRQRSIFGFRIGSR